MLPKLITAKLLPKLVMFPADVNNEWQFTLSTILNEINLTLLCNSLPQVQIIKISIKLGEVYCLEVQLYIIALQNDVSMVDMNVKNIYKEEWCDSVRVNEIDSASVVKEMIDVRDGSVKFKKKKVFFINSDNHTIE